MFRFSCSPHAHCDKDLCITFPFCPHRKDEFALFLTVPLVSRRHGSLLVLTSALLPFSLSLSLSSSLYSFVASGSLISVSFSNYHATRFTATEPTNFWCWINHCGVLTPAQIHSLTTPICFSRTISAAFTWLGHPCVRSCVSKWVQWIFAEPCVCVTVCLHLCVCVWSFCPVRQGQMVLGGWLSSWWLRWWYCYEVYWSAVQPPPPCLNVCLSASPRTLSL